MVEHLFKRHLKYRLKPKYKSLKYLLSIIFKKLRNTEFNKNKKWRYTSAAVLLQTTSIKNL